jgi:hypothetical protein
MAGRARLRCPAVEIAQLDGLLASECVSTVDEAFTRASPCGLAENVGLRLVRDLRRGPWREWGLPQRHAPCVREVLSRRPHSPLRCRACYAASAGGKGYAVHVGRPLCAAPTLQAGVTEAVLAADTQGNIFSSFPLAEDGNYAFWVFSDPYKATVSKEDGSEVEEDIYEAYNFGLVRCLRETVQRHCAARVTAAGALPAPPAPRNGPAHRGRHNPATHARTPCPRRPPQLVSGQKDSISQGQGVRIGGEKYMWLRELKGETYIAKASDRGGAGLKGALPDSRAQS